MGTCTNNNYSYGDLIYHDFKVVEDLGDTVSVEYEHFERVYEKVNKKDKRCNLYNYGPKLKYRKRFIFNKDDIYTEKKNIMKYICEKNNWESKCDKFLNCTL